MCTFSFVVLPHPTPPPKVHLTPPPAILPAVVCRYINGNTAAVPVASDDDAVATAGRQAASRTYGFVWTQMTELSIFMFRRCVGIVGVGSQAGIGVGVVVGCVESV